jgi:tetrahydromethanopterin S-methyltransferase subunit F
MRWELRHIFNNAHNRADLEMLSGSSERKTELYPRNRRLFMDLEVTEIAGQAAR